MFLEAQHITKTFGAYCALNDVSIGVREGSIFGLLGPNGAGKTTLIRIINRILRPDSGTLLLDGKPIGDSDVQQIGYLPEERGLYKKMRVGDQAIYLARLKGLGHAEAEKRLRRWFEKFDIGSWWNRPVEELSKGMQQKVQFIVTVLHEPRLLIFDEPFSGFDPVNATLLKDEILELREQGATVIFSTHNMASVEELCDDIALIHRSSVLLSGNVERIRRSYGRNRYEVAVAATQAPQLPEWCHIEEQHRNDEELTLRVALPAERTANDLLGLLLPQCRVQSLHEVLPSMNDIFIKTVSGM